MKLHEIFEQLTTGEFSQISIGGAPAGVIDETNQGKAIAHINLGLTSLYKRFNLKEGRLVLALQPAQTLYKLSSTVAVSVRHTREPVRYILDSVAEPFQDDILKVEKVLSEEDEEYPLNDSNQAYSVFTPSALKLRVPEILVPADVDDTLTIVYRANHPKLKAVACGVCEEEVQLPDSHLEALLYFVASRAHNPIGMSNEFHAGNSYAAKYEKACQELEGKGLQVDITVTNDRLVRTGFP